MTIRQNTQWENRKELKDLCDAYMQGYGIQEKIALITLFHNIDHNVSDIVEELEAHITRMEEDNILYAVLNKAEKISILKQIVEFKQGQSEDSVKYSQGMAAFAEMMGD